MLIHSNILFFLSLWLFVEICHENSVFIFTFEFVLMFTSGVVIRNLYKVDYL